MTSGTVAVAAAYREQDEIDDAIRAWTDADYLRMVARASAASFGTDMEPKDVLAEAVELLMAGNRPWKFGVPFQAHVTMVMKSVGFNRRRSLKSHPSVELATLDARDGVQTGGGANEADSIVRAKQLGGDVERAFGDDIVGWAVFVARKFEGASIEEACELAGINREQFDTVMKRVNRTLARAVQSGVIR